MTKITVESPQLTPQLEVAEIVGAPQFPFEELHGGPILELGSAPRNLGPIFFLDVDGDWAYTNDVKDAIGRPRGALYTDADGDIAVDTTVVANGILLSRQWDLVTDEVIVF